MHTCSTAVQQVTFESLIYFVSSSKENYTCFGTVFVSEMSVTEYREPSTMVGVIGSTTSVKLGPRSISMSVASLNLPLSRFCCCRIFPADAPCSVAITQFFVDTFMPCQYEQLYQLTPKSFLSLYIIDCLSASCLSCVVNSAFFICWLTTKSYWWVRRTIITSDCVKKPFDLRKSLDSGAQDCVVIKKTAEAELIKFIVALKLGMVNFGKL